MKQFLGSECVRGLQVAALLSLASDISTSEATLSVWPSTSSNTFTANLTLTIGGTDYTVQFSTNLSSTNWSTLLITNPPHDAAWGIQDNQATNRQRFYRVTRGP